MKALLITAIASFFALTVSAQVATDTKTTGTIATEKKELSTRPAKVADSTTPTLQNAQGTNTSSKPINTNNAIVEKPKPETKANHPAGITKEVKADNPGSQKLSTGRRDRPVMKDETPKE